MTPARWKTSPPEPGDLVRVWEIDERGDIGIVIERDGIECKILTHEGMIKVERAVIWPIYCCPNTRDSAVYNPDTQG